MTNPVNQMVDQVLEIGKSQIQHGKSNDRVYLMKLYREHYQKTIDQIEHIANENQYSKIFTKVPEWASSEFEARGYRLEASIPRFYQNRIEACFYSRFLSNDREKINDEEKRIIEDTIKLAQSKQHVENPLGSQIPYEIRILSESDASELAEVYRNVFQSYPFPIHEPDFLKSMMQDSVIYFGAFENGKLIAASSAEMDRENYNVEMTDFATLPEYRGHGIAVHLLSRMEKEMWRLKIPSLYTIARALSPGMNITFAKMGYQFAGTLVNNTQISGKIESMNVWYKTLGL